MQELVNSLLFVFTIANAGFVCYWVYERRLVRALVQLIPVVTGVWVLAYTVPSIVGG